MWNGRSVRSRMRAITGGLIRSFQIDSPLRPFRNQRNRHRSHYVATDPRATLKIRQKVEEGAASPGHYWLAGALCFEYPPFCLHSTRPTAR